MRRIAVCRSGAVLIALASLILMLSRAHASPSIAHEVNLVIEPDDASIAIQDRFAVSGQNSLVLRISNWMTLSEIRVNGTPAEWTRSGNLHRLELPGRGTHKIALTASGVVSGLDMKNALHRSGGAAVAAPGGIYLPGWSGWLPAVAGHTSAYSLSVVTPATYRATATGALKSETLGPESNVSVFSVRAGIEAPSVFAGPYVVNEKLNGGIRIRTYFHRDSVRFAEAYLNGALAYIRKFEHQIGPYPFADFAIVAAPIPVGLGFPNLTYVHRRILPLPFMQGRSLAHEVLHNWWGNGVYADYASGNWSEGLTTYMADHGLAEDTGPDRAREMRLGWLRDYAALSTDLDRAVKSFVSKKHDASQVIGYGKVAYIFHMLKHEVGAERFSKAIKRLWHDHKFTAASWRDIQTTFEATISRPLDWFFQQWIDRTGAPQLTLKDVKAAKTGDVHRVQFTLSQSAQIYRLKVPVLIGTENSEKRFEVEIGSAEKTVTLEIKQPPVVLQIDPDNSVFRRLLPDEAPPIARDILLDRTAAAVMLHKQGDLQNASRALTERLLGRRPEFMPAGHTDPVAAVPLVVQGTTAQIDAFIVAADLPARPARISGAGDARAWTVRAQSGKAILLVEADTPATLRAMLRSLPHYRSKSFVIFEGGRAVNHGVWPVSGGPLTKKF